MNSYKIYRYLEPWQLPPSLDIHPGHIVFPDSLNRNLPKKQFIALGERRKTIFFDRFEDDKFIDPVIKVDYRFNRDEAGLLKSKERSISWQLEDNTWSKKAQEDIIPVISNEKKLQEIKRRRRNIVDEVAGLSVDIGLESALTDLYARYYREISLYVDSGLLDFKEALNNNTDLYWLDRPTPSNSKITVRQFLTNYFSVGTKTS